MEIVDVDLNIIEVDQSINFKKPNEYLLNKMVTKFQRFGQVEFPNAVRLANGRYLITSNTELIKVAKILGLQTFKLLVHESYDAALLCALGQEIRFENDYFIIAAVTKKLNDMGTSNKRLQHSLPWSETELANMQKMARFDWDTFGEPDQDNAQLSLL